MTSDLATGPLRAEHRELPPHLRALQTAADELAQMDRSEAVRTLGDIVAFLRDHLVPHARAEEAVLYPAVEEAMNAPGATATMRADHAEIVARIERLADTANAVGERWPDPRLAVDLTPRARRAVRHPAPPLPQGGCPAPVLDAHLTAEQASALFARMGESAHQ
jgi:Hemerythrin HHE cation binding domain